MYGISFTNALLYSRAVPMPGDREDKADKPLFDETKDACNPDNFEDFDAEDVTINDI